MHEFQIPLYEQMAERDKDFYDRLEKAGFDHDWGDDGSGLFMKYLRRGSGYYIDVGAAELVANGDVKLAHGQVDHLTEHSVVLADGTELRGRPGRLRDRLRLDERLGCRPDQPRGGRHGRQGLGPGLGHHQGPRPVGGRAAQHVEAHPAARACGSTAATCTSRGTTRCTWRCSSRRAWRGSTPRCTPCRRCTTPRERAFLLIQGSRSGRRWPGDPTGLLRTSDRVQPESTRTAEPIEAAQGLPRSARRVSGRRKTGLSCL